MKHEKMEKMKSKHKFKTGKLVRTAHTRNDSCEEGIIDWSNNLKQPSEIKDDTICSYRLKNAFSLKQEFFKKPTKPKNLSLLKTKRNGYEKVVLVLSVCEEALLIFA